MKPVHIRLLSWAASLAVGGIASVLLLGVGTYYYLAPGLPDVEALRDTRLQLPLRVYSRDGQLLAQIGDQRRVPVKFAEIPPHVVQAFIDAEDDRFFEHGGIDVMGLTRSLLLAVLRGELSQGGSTITQQLARNVFPIGREKELKRKLREIFLSFRLESEFSKQEILTLYLNKIYLGEKAYGVAAAAEAYFGKSLDDLTIAEAATLGGLPQRPARVNPVANPEAMRHRRAYVLRRMYAKSHITEEEYNTALEAPMQSRSHGAGAGVDAPYVAEMVRTALFEQFGAVDRVSLVTDRETGKARGFGFVEMAQKSEAEAAIAALNGRDLDGRAINVNEARPKEDRGGAGGGGGYRGRSGGGGGGGGRGGGQGNRW